MVWCPYSLDFQMKMGQALLGLLQPFPPPSPHPSGYVVQVGCSQEALWGNVKSSDVSQDQSRVQQEEWMS